MGLRDFFFFLGFKVLGKGGAGKEVEDNNKSGNIKMSGQIAIKDPSSNKKVRETVERDKSEAERRERESSDSVPPKKPLFLHPLSYYCTYYYYYFYMISTQGDSLLGPSSI